MRQTACLVAKPNMVDSHAALLNGTIVGRVSDPMIVPT